MNAERPRPHDKTKGDALKFKITLEDREAILHASLIDGIKIFRSYSHFGLKDAKEAVEALRSGRMKLEDFFEPKEPCSHCNGTGFVSSKDSDQR